jgi:TPR repeat protein
VLPTFRPWARGFAGALLLAGACQSPPRATPDATAAIDPQHASPRVQALHREAAWSPEAMRELGLACARGDGCPVDTERARHLWAVAANRGDPGAMVLLGLCFKDGRFNAPEDVSQARAWFERAAVRGDPEALKRLADLYGDSDSLLFNKTESNRLYAEAWARLRPTDDPPRLRIVAAEMLRWGKGTARNLEAAAEALRPLVAAGDPIAMVDYAYTLEYMHPGTATPWAEVRTLNLTAAEHGNPQALWSLGWKAWNGLGQEKDRVAAERWLRQGHARGDASCAYTLGELLKEEGKTDEATAIWEVLAARGNRRAQLSLAEFYLEKKPPADDAARARRLLEAAAATGYRRAMMALATAWAGGRLGPPDKARSAMWLRRAEENAEGQDCIDLARAYEKLGGRANYREAERLYLKAADLGEAYANCALGYLYGNDESGLTDPHKEYLAFKRGADKGDPYSMMGLADWHFYGRGGNIDMAETRAWYEKAAALGHASAQEWLRTHPK